MTRIVSFSAFLRGTGKSNIVANVAALLGLTGLRVGIVDLDEAAPTLPLLFGLADAEVTATLGDALMGRNPIEDATYDVTPEPVAAAGGCLLLVPLTMKPGQMPLALRGGLDTDRLDAALHALAQRRELDVVLIDSSSGLNELSLNALAMSDLAFFVLRLEKRDYQGTAVTLDLARRLNVPRIALVANLTLSGVDARVASLQLAGTYGAEAAAVLPYNAEMAALGSAGLFVLAYPDHALTGQLRRLAGWVG